MGSWEDDDFHDHNIGIETKIQRKLSSLYKALIIEYERPSSQREQNQIDLLKSHIQMLEGIIAP